MPMPSGHRCLSSQASQLSQSLLAQYLQCRLPNPPLLPSCPTHIVMALLYLRPQEATQERSPSRHRSGEPRVGRPRARARSPALKTLRLLRNIPKLPSWPKHQNQFKAAL